MIKLLLEKNKPPCLKYIFILAFLFFIFYFYGLNKGLAEDDLYHKDVLSAFDEEELEIQEDLFEPRRSFNVKSLQKKIFEEVLKSTQKTKSLETQN